jgi:nucleoside-diphosphate-sugar epimerase
MSAALRSCAASSVIHCAGFGLSGTSNLPAFDDLTKKINVDGTEAVVEACLINDVVNLGKHLFNFCLRRWDSNPRSFSVYR